eukprot:19536-Eustigmatos_ZCMA.PRE.1
MAERARSSGFWPLEAAVTCFSKQLEHLRQLSTHAAASAASPPADNEVGKVGDSPPVVVIVGAADGLGCEVPEDLKIDVRKFDLIPVADDVRTQTSMEELDG